MAVTSGRAGGAPAVGLTLGGAGTGVPLWVDVLTSVTALPATRRRSGEAASAGAALLGASAIGCGLSLDQLDPVVAEIEPDPAGVDLYRSLRPAADRVASAVIELGLGDLTGER
jgi:sugar (pentulose or hexulose) kinase